MKVELLMIDEKEYRELDMESYSSIAAFQRLGVDYKRELKESAQFSEEDYLIGSIVDTVISDELNTDDYLSQNYIQTKDKPSSLKMKLLSSLYLLKTSYELQPSTVDDILANKEPLKLAQVASLFYKKADSVTIDDKDRNYFRLLELVKSSNKKGILSNYQANVIKMGIACIRNNCEEIARVDPSKKLSQIFYQKKFCFEVKGVKIKCMLDIIHVDHVKKEITPIDLKTSMNGTDKIISSFSKYGYYIQSGIYKLAVVNFFKNHAVYHDYKVKDFKFIFYHIMDGKYSEFVVDKKLYLDSFKMRLLYSAKTASAHPSMSTSYYDDEYFDYSFYLSKDRINQMKKDYISNECNPSIHLRANKRKGIVQLLEEMSIVSNLHFDVDENRPNLDGLSYYSQKNPSRNFFNHNYASRDKQLYQYFIIKE